MNRMDYKAALFDVDGTIVNGNCTQIFIQYLLDEGLVKNSDLSQYNRFLKNYSPLVGNNLKIAEEAFTILSGVSKQELTKTWKDCFRTRIKNRFNDLLVKEVQFYQSKGVEVFLASGSLDIFIREIAATLSISEKNIVATKLEEANGQESADPKIDYCIGKGKEYAVLDLFKKRSIKINDVCFFTDNLSDLKLLHKAGKGYWVGSKSKFVSESMSKNGIEQLIQDAKFPSLNLQNKVLLDEYYLERKSIIEQSISTIFPLKCKQQSIDNIVGKSYANWDLPTMQKTYFDPINKYLEKYNSRLVTLGTCIFLEAGGLKLDDYLPLLSVGELLNLSNEVFVDITNWTSADNLYKCEKSHVEISILGNASISLLSLPLHNIIHDKPYLDAEIKLKLYELYTSVVHYSLFGNGIKFHWEQQSENRISIEEYIHVATLMNKGLLQFGTDLFLILSEQHIDKALNNIFRSFSENSAILIQLLRDRIAFNNWQNNKPHDRKNKFHFFTNLICIHACWITNNPKLFNENLTKDEVNKIFKSANSLEYLEENIKKYQSKVDHAISSLPFSDRYKSLINSYINQLVRL